MPPNLKMKRWRWTVRLYKDPGWCCLYSTIHKTKPLHLQMPPLCIHMHESGISLTFFLTFFFFNSWTFSGGNAVTDSGLWWASVYLKVGKPYTLSSYIWLNELSYLIHMLWYSISITTVYRLKQTALNMSWRPDLPIWTSKEVQIMNILWSTIICYGVIMFKDLF